MKSKILEVVINLVRNQAVAMVLCFLMWMDALCTSPTNHLWTNFGANMTSVFGGDFTEVTATSLFFCAAIASANPAANLACYLSSRCVFASVCLPDIGGKQTGGFKCWYTDGLPPLRTTCTAPFTQHSFGCMYNSQEFLGTYCEAVKYCQELGANLASPKTEEHSQDMFTYYQENQYGLLDEFYVGLFFVNGKWRWPANQREALQPDSSGEWGSGKPDGSGNATVMFPLFDAFYKIKDTPINEKHKALCHIWNVY